MVYFHCMAKQVLQDRKEKNNVKITKIFIKFINHII